MYPGHILPGQVYSQPYTSVHSLSNSHLFQTNSSLSSQPLSQTIQLQGGTTGALGQVGGPGGVHLVRGNINGVLTVNNGSQGIIHYTYTVAIFKQNEKLKNLFFYELFDIFIFMNFLTFLFLRSISSSCGRTVQTRNQGKDFLPPFSSFLLKNRFYFIVYSVFLHL